MNYVLITVSNQKTRDIYYAKSYPDSDRNKDGYMEAYQVPVYKVFVEGKDDKGRVVVKEWKALRFMPFWNDPQDPVAKYKTRGFLSAGLHSFPKQAVRNYVKTYSVSNTRSEYIGAIQLKGNFLIHAGPKDLSQLKWGSAGCIEIIGDFNQFRKDIITLSGYKTTEDIGTAMDYIMKKGYLFVEIIYEAPPILKSNSVF